MEPLLEDLMHAHDTERLKTLSVWDHFEEGDLDVRPAHLGRTAREQMVHQCVSEATWMSRMLGFIETLPHTPEVESKAAFIQLYAARSAAYHRHLRNQSTAWFLEPTTFFDATRTRYWVLTRRLLHTAHHRGQLTLLLRLLGHPLYSTYGPTADTGGLFQNGAQVRYRHPSVGGLLAHLRQDGPLPGLPGPGFASPTERPLSQPAAPAAFPKEVP